MTRYILGYGGEWQERFGDREAAIRHAEAVAKDGTVVEVVRRRFGFHGFLTAFPESEREALKARWRLIPIVGAGFFGGGSAGGHQHSYTPVHGGGGGHGGGHGHGGH